MKELALRLVPSFAGPLIVRIRSSDLGSRLARGTFWSLVGMAASKMLAMAASIAVARILKVKGFGEIGIVQSTIGMLGVFAGFGLGTTAVKHVAEWREIAPERVGRILALSSLVAWGSGGIMALALLAGGPWLASNSLGAPHLGGLLRIASILLLLSAVNGAQMGALAGFEAFRVAARVNVFAGLASLPLTVGGAYIGGTQGMVWGLAASTGVHCLFNNRALRGLMRDARIEWRFSDCWSERRVLHRFSLPSLLAGSLVGPVYWLCNTLLVNRPGGYIQMGIFNAANQWFGVMMFFPGLLGNVVLPVMSETLGKDDRDRMRRLLVLSLKINGAVVLPLVALFSIFSPWIMAAYGPGFAGHGTTLVLSVVTAGLLALQVPVGQVLVAGGRIWTGFFMNLGWAAALYGFTYLLIGRGATGLAAARLIAYLFHAIWTFGYASVLLRNPSNAEG